MSVSPELSIVLDACVIYPAALRDILMNLAKRDFYLPLWSDKIHEEWTRNLLKKNKKVTRKSVLSTVRFMNQAFSGATVKNYEYLIPTLNLPDPDDRHILAAAIEAKADRILTFNLKDFPTDYIRTFGIEVQHPDDFICELIQTNEAAVKVAFEAQISKLKNPPMTILEGITALEKNEMEKTGQLLREIFLK